MRRFLAAIAIFIQVNFLAAAVKANNWIVEKISVKPIAQNLASVSFMEEVELKEEKKNNAISEVLNVSSLPVLKNDAVQLSLAAEAAVALDVDSDIILFNKQAKEQKRIASLTKLMTAAVVLENTKLDEVVTISKFAIDTEGSFCNLKAGEQITVENLLHVMILRSSNDASVAFAEHVGGSVSDFVEMMNQKAADLGMRDTTFSCPSGLDDNGNFSTAYDMAQLADYALGHPLIWEIMRIQEETVESIDGEHHYLKNTNKLLQYSGDILGGKTGYTEGAGGCLLLVSQHPENGHRIVSVVLNADDRFVESQKLFEWVFDSYQW